MSVESHQLCAHLPSAVYCPVWQSQELVELFDNILTLRNRDILSICKSAEWFPGKAGYFPYLAWALMELRSYDSWLDLYTSSHKKWQENDHEKNMIEVFVLLAQSTAQVLWFWPLTRQLIPRGWATKKRGWTEAWWTSLTGGPEVEGLFSIILRLFLHLFPSFSHCFPFSNFFPFFPIFFLFLPVLFSSVPAFKDGIAVALVFSMVWSCGSPAPLNQPRVPRYNIPWILWCWPNHQSLNMIGIVICSDARCCSHLQSNLEIDMRWYAKKWMQWLESYCVCQRAENRANKGVGVGWG